MGKSKRAKAKLIVQVPLEARSIERLQQEFPEAEFPLCITPEALHEEIGEADALIGGASLTPDLLEAAPKLRWVAATSAGVENLPIDALAERGILLTNFSGIAAPNIAEHVLAMMLAFARALRPLFHRQDQHQWPEDDAALPTFELGGQTLGIIGMGEIGQHLARKAHGIGMRVLAIQRHPDRKPAYVARLLAGDALPELLGSMAELQPRLVETDGRRLAAEVLRRTRHRALVVLFTTLDEAAITEGILPVLPSLTARHMVMVASVTDPAVLAMAGDYSDAAAVYDAAAAERTMASARRVGALLRRLGVDVVEGPPDEFGSKVADAYLSLKAAGRL